MLRLRLSEWSSCDECEPKRPFSLICQKSLVASSRRSLPSGRTSDAASPPTASLEPWVGDPRPPGHDSGVRRLDSCSLSSPGGDVGGTLGGHGHNRRGIFGGGWGDSQTASLSNCHANPRRPVLHRPTIVGTEVIAELEPNPRVIAEPQLGAAADVEGGERALAVANAHAGVAGRHERGEFGRSNSGEMNRGVRRADDQAIEEAELAAYAQMIGNDGLTASTDVEGIRPAAEESRHAGQPAFGVAEALGVKAGGAGQAGEAGKGKNNDQFSHRTSAGGSQDPPLRSNAKGTPEGAQLSSVSANRVRRSPDDAGVPV